MSSYTLHRAGCAPFIHNPEAANLPHVDTVRNTLRSNSLTAAEFDRWKQRSSSTSNDPFLLAKLAMNGLLPSPQDVWDVCCGYETKHQELRCSFAEYVRTSGDTISALQKEILQVSIPPSPQLHRRNCQPTLVLTLIVCVCVVLCAAAKECIRRSSSAPSDVGRLEGHAHQRCVPSAFIWAGARIFCSYDVNGSWGQHGQTQAWCGPKFGATHHPINWWGYSGVASLVNFGDGAFTGRIWVEWRPEDLQRHLP